MSQHDTDGTRTRGQRELIVLTRDDMGTTGFRGAAAAEPGSVAGILARAGAQLRPLFETAGNPAGSATRSAADDGQARYYRVEATDDQLDALARELLAADEVEAAYVKPAAELAVMTLERPAGTAAGINDMAPTGDAVPATPDYTDRQIYLNAAPEGIDARYAWRFPGGRGANVRVIDLEWGWQFSHEDLAANSGGLIAGTNASDHNHGTAVLGEIGADDNGFGVTGIASDARLSTVAFSMPTATAIRTAADNLRAGDIMLLEIHRPGP